MKGIWGGAKISSKEKVMKGKNGGTKNLKSLPVTVWIWQCQLDYLSLWVNPRGFQSAKVNAKVRLLAWNLDFSKPFFVERWFSYPWYLSDHEVHSFPMTLDSFLVLPEREFYFSTGKLNPERFFRLAPPIKSRLYQLDSSYLKSLLSFLFNQFVLLF